MRLCSAPTSPPQLSPQLSLFELPPPLKETLSDDVKKTSGFKRERNRITGELRRILSESDQHGEPTLIILRGLSGSGKTGAVKVIHDDLKGRGIPILDNPTYDELGEAFGLSRRVFVTMPPTIRPKLPGITIQSVNQYGYPEGFVSKNILDHELARPITVFGFENFTLTNHIQNITAGKKDRARVGKAWRESFLFLVRNFEHLWNEEDFKNPDKMLDDILTHLGDDWFRRDSYRELFIKSFQKSYEKYHHELGQTGRNILAIIAQCPLNALQERYLRFTSTTHDEPYICITARHSESETIHSLFSNISERVACAISGSVLRKAHCEQKTEDACAVAPWSREKSLRFSYPAQVHLNAKTGEQNHIQLILSHHFQTEDIIQTALIVETILRDSGVEYVVTMGDTRSTVCDTFHHEPRAASETPITLDQLERSHPDALTLWTQSLQQRFDF